MPPWRLVAARNLLWRRDPCVVLSRLRRGFPSISSGYSSISASNLTFGQPVHETHPHILKPGELTPGITAQEYHLRRASLASSLPDNSIAIISAADLKFRSGVVFYEFHQSSNFLYLTGFDEPEALAVIHKVRGDDWKFYLFVRGKDAKAERWEGARSGVQAALDVFNADEAGDVINIEALLSPLVKEASDVYTNIPERQASQLSDFLNGTDSLSGLSGLLRGTKTKPLKPFMEALRVVKSEAEVANMRLAGKISGRAITQAMQQSFSRERDLGNFIEYEFKRGGCDSSAYVPVIAGASNALCIHYVRNDDVLRSGDAVLVDAGGEYGHYVTDITRTWPVSGKFTATQKDLYEVVLRAQRKGVALCRESADMTLDKIHDATSRALSDGLQELGFDMGGKALDELFPHHVGHHVGLDVHDCSSIPRTRHLEPGMCVTIEPGIYVPDDERWPRHFRGLGIRIEDSVCVGRDHPIVLTTEAVKDVVDIEALRDV